TMGDLPLVAALRTPCVSSPAFLPRVVTARPALQPIRPDLDVLILVWDLVWSCFLRQRCAPSRQGWYAIGHQVLFAIVRVAVQQHIEQGADDAEHVLRVSQVLVIVNCSTAHVVVHDTDAQPALVPEWLQFVLEPLELRLAHITKVAEVP